MRNVLKGDKWNPINMFLLGVKMCYIQECFSKEVMEMYEKMTQKGSKNSRQRRRDLITITRMINND